MKQWVLAARETAVQQVAAAGGHLERAVQDIAVQGDERAANTETVNAAAG